MFWPSVFFFPAHGDLLQHAINIKTGGARGSWLDITLVMLVCKVVQGFVLPPLDEIYFSYFYKFQSLAFEQRALLLLAASRALDDAKLLAEGGHIEEGR